MRRLIAQRDTRLLLLGLATSLFGDSMMLLVLAIWMKDLTGSSGAAGAVILLVVAPGLGAPAAGYLVDRVRRRRFLIIASSLSAIAVLPLLAVGERGPTWVLAVVAVLYGVSFAFIGPGTSALVRSSVDDDLLVDANSFLQTAREGFRLVGPLLGATLYATVGGAAVAVIDAATFLIAAGCLAAVRSPDPKPERTPHESFTAEATAGFRHIRATPVLRRSITTTAVALLVVGFCEAVTFAVVDDGLHRAPTFIGVLSSAQGVGAIAGGLTAARLIRRRGEPFVLGAGFLALAVGCGLWMPPSTAVVLIGTALFGMGVAWASVAFRTLLQRLSPGHLQGRVSAAAELAVAAPSSLSIGLGAIAVSAIDFRYLLVAMVVVLAACAADLTRTRSRPEAKPRHVNARVRALEDQMS